ncbi:hypothetical protein WNZ14_10260 [Hoeflea sp. AS60]|uniref:peptidoglycan-binding domain-containing protein n=1 Tax=Hoeflea sp. AS60 TaxID=3135780 RepID=UPI003176D5C6
MKHVSILSLGFGLAASPAGAAVCVSPFDGASTPVTQSVEQLDPGGLGPAAGTGLFQEGRVAGYIYRIYSDSSALLSERSQNPNWAVDLHCGGDPVQCKQTWIGPIPDDAVDLGSQLARCLRSGSERNEGIPYLPEATADLPAIPSSEEPAPVNSHAGLAAAAAVATQQALDASVSRVPLVEETLPPEFRERPSATNDLPTTLAGENIGGEATRPDARLGVSLQPSEGCGLSGVPREGVPILVLQRLLVEAGHHIQPLDGLMGPQTRSALEAQLGQGNGDLEIETAITRVDAALCKRAVR